MERPGDARLAVCFAARTDIGRRRKTNEDFFAIDEVRSLFVVADGLGGHVAGRIASEIASYRFVERIRQQVEEEPLPALREAFQDAHGAIRERVSHEPELAGMATTLVALWFRDDRACLGHVGDSRIYLLRGAELHPLSHDHSLVSEMVFSGRLSPEAARSHPHRHVITRALGVGLGAEPDTAELRLEPGDLFMLCSDGVSGPIEEEEIRELLLAAKGDLSLAADTLIGLANDRGGEDNATIILVSVS